MSKIIAFFISFVAMILAWFGISIGGGADTTQPEIPGTEVVSTVEQTEELSTEETTVDPTEPESGKVRENAYKTNIAVCCSYVKDREAHENYPDTYSSELTDGIYSLSGAPSYYNASFSGYTKLRDKPMTIDVELGDKCDKIYGFELSYLAVDVDGIDIPKSVSVFISDDGKNWTSAGKAVIPSEIDGTVKQAVLTLEEYVSAGYVRFSISGNSPFVFLNEVIVVADKEALNSQSDFCSAVASAYEKYGAQTAPADGEGVDKTLSKVSVSKGKSYIISCDTVAPFTDNGLILTDGSKGNAYESGAYAGLYCSSAQTVTVDLGEEVTDIAGIELCAYSRVPSGIYLPCAVSFTAISADGTRSSLGTSYAAITKDIGVYVFSIEFNKTVRAVSIEAEFASTPCSRLCLIDELNVYAYRDCETDVEPYPGVNLSFKDNGKWDENESDYNEYRNLLLGCDAQIVSGSSLSESAKSRNTPASSGLLTDGNHASSTNIYSGAYQIFYSGKSRQIVFDLQKEAALDKFVCEFTNQSGWAVHAPSQVTVYLSQNGCDWYKAANMSVDTSTDPSVISASYSADAPVAARYLCFEFNINVFAGCSEIEAYGTKNTDRASALSDTQFEYVQLYKNERIRPSEAFLDGAKDTCLLYHSKTSGYTAQQLIPYVGYVDGDGSIHDTMFDSFLFLMSGLFPSGLSPQSDSTLSDWKWCIDDLFTQNENIMALEEAVGILKEELGLPADYTVPFTVAVYCPSVRNAAFGDIDADGENEDLSVESVRINALKSYADMFEERLSGYDFKNIKFSGYYWMNESMNTADGDDKVAKAFSEYVHERDYDFFWIPYYCANGYSSWQNYGFDCAVMQPNYMFTSEDAYSKLVSCAKLTELYGMGIEIEISGSVFSSDDRYERYMKYLSDGVKYGYMDDTVAMYYQDFLVYNRAAYSDSARDRLIYDNTYDFIKGKLNVYPDELDDRTFICKADNIFSGSLNLPESGWTAVAVTKQPEHGSLTASQDGTFMYFPEKGFSGEVEFTYTYSVSLEHSGQCKATIIIQP